MTLYQSEMQRKAHGHGCEARMDEADESLLISYNGELFAYVSKIGFLEYPYPKDDKTEELIRQLKADAKLVREYVGIYESAPPMKCEDVPEYRQFSEFGSVVFAGMHSDKHGFMFCTWSQDMGGTYLAHGHYTPNYQAAKEDFATRAGLISESRLFTLDESSDIHGCIDYTKENCDNLTYEEDKRLSELQSKLEDAYPSLSENPPDFGQNEGMNINM